MPDLADGETAEVQGSAADPYILKNTGGVYSCSCPAWRNQSTPIEKRTCKHLRKYRGEAAEVERIGNALPGKPVKAPKVGGTGEGDEAEAAGPPLLLAQTWTNDQDLTGWWMSEKLDGVRAFWDGKQFISRLGNVFHAPDWFKAALPDVPLDGELWLDRKSFQRTISIVRRQDKSDHWKQIKYLVFDAPQVADVFERRVEAVREFVSRKPVDFVLAHDHILCKGVAHLEEELARMESVGGEGLMLRQPGSKYVAGRSSTLVKVKKFYDAEARVLDHQAGAGRHKGRLGALVVEMADGTKFSVGTGFSDKERGDPPAVGSLITFRYQELSDRGVPRFPSYVGRREEGGGPSLLLPETAKPAGVAKKSAAANPPAKGKQPAKPADEEEDEEEEGDEEETPAAKPAKGAAAEVRRHFELEDGKSSKFWEVKIAGTEVTVRFGRIGTDGQSKVKEFPTEAAANSYAEKLIDEKTEKGYEETG